MMLLGAMTWQLSSEGGKEVKEGKGREEREGGSKQGRKQGSKEARKEARRKQDGNRGRGGRT
jgi:hypothetical protein